MLSVLEISRFIIILLLTIAMEWRLNVVVIDHLRVRFFPEFQDLVDLFLM